MNFQKIRNKLSNFEISIKWINNKWQKKYIDYEYTNNKLI